MLCPSPQTCQSTSGLSHKACDTLSVSDTAQLDVASGASQVHSAPPFDARQAALQLAKARARERRRTLLVVGATHAALVLLFSLAEYARPTHSFSLEWFGRYWPRLR